MENEVEVFPVTRLDREGRHNIEETVVRELPVTIIFNDQELVTMLCSPSDLKALAVGFLSSEGILQSKDDIKKIIADETRGVVRLETTSAVGFNQDDIFKRIITSGCGRGATFYSAADAGEERVESRLKISPDEIFALSREFQHNSKLFQATGGVHSAALCDRTSILAFKEDIGRHNAIDKLFGECLLKGIPTDERIIITSGRISSEILLKVVKRNIPVIVTKAAPTSLGVKLADKLGVTLVGFVRGKRMNIYSHGERITDSSASQNEAK